MTQDYQEVMIGTLRKNCREILLEIRDLEQRLHGKESTSYSEQKDAARESVLRLKQASQRSIRLGKILEAEYVVGTPPDDWYVGYIQKQGFLKYVLYDQMEQTYLIYRQVLPRTAEKKYRIAQARKLFDEIIIASPFREDFSVFGRGATVFAIYGFIQANPTQPLENLARSRSSFFQYHLLQNNFKNAMGFMIASWDDSDEKNEFKAAILKIIGLRAKLADISVSLDARNLLDEIIDRLLFIEDTKSALLKDDAVYPLRFEFIAATQDLAKLFAAYIGLSDSGRVENNEKFIAALNLLMNHINEIEDGLTQIQNSTFELQEMLIRSKLDTLNV